jgi:hypothetical protein
MKTIFAALFVAEVEAVIERGGDALLGERVAALDEDQRELLRESLDEIAVNLDPLGGECISTPQSCNASVTRRLARSTPRRRNLTASHIGLFGVPPPRPNVSSSATAHSANQLRLKGRSALIPAATTRIALSVRRVVLTNR